MHQSHQGALGILMLDTAFERLHGDIGNPDTWPFPVQYRVLPACTPAAVIELDGQSALGEFLSAIDELIDLGVCGITTSCGFLGLYQPALAAHSRVPVATSALLQAPVIERLLPAGKRVGILTFNATALTAAHLNAVGVDAATPMAGLDRSPHFYRWIMEGRHDIALSALEADVVTAARELQQQHPDVGALVAECTNLGPFASAIHDATGLPVYDIVTLVNWFRQGLKPLRFAN